MGNLPVWIQKLLQSLAVSWPAFGTFLSGVMINAIMKATRARPHPWSTKTDYVSWPGLTDRTYSARHLPSADIPSLPDIDEVTTLFTRTQAHQLFCPKSTTLFPAFAQYLTDGFLRTQLFNEDERTDRLKTTSNHEIDLCPLYGRNEAQTLALRLRSNAQGEKGRLKSQNLPSGPSNEIEEYPLFLFDTAGAKLKEFDDLDDPLGSHKLPLEIKTGLFAVGGDRVNANLYVAMLNTLFLREHNRLAALIEAANPKFDDDRVFNVARNVLIVMFIKIVVEEYINHIAPTMLSFEANPKVAWMAPWNRPNWMSIEFGLLYRWHGLVPDKTQWKGQEIPTSIMQFNTKLLIETGLSQALVEVSGQRAARLGLGNTSDFLLGVEKKGIDQGRIARIDTYNAYRAAFDLPVANTWSDVTGDDNRRKRLEAVYGATPEKLEFFTGLFAEDRTPNSPLPILITKMVAVDAFSQAMTNPLLSKSIWGTQKVKLEAFTQVGLDAITTTKCVRDMLAHQVTRGNMPKAHIGMTRLDWRFGEEPNDHDKSLTV
jgi:prostaglandin-endoperoxide synthase 2